MLLSSAVLMVYVVSFTENDAPSVYSPTFVGSANNVLSTADATSAFFAPIEYSLPAIVILSPILSASIVNVADLVPSSRVPLRPAS